MDVHNTQLLLTHKKVAKPCHKLKFSNLYNLGNLMLKTLNHAKYMYSTIDQIIKV